MQDSEIHVVRDADSRAFSKLFVERIQGRIVTNHAEKKKTLIFFYYAGHGILKGHTKAVCNQGEIARKVFYPLEGNLRSMGALPGAYVIGVFDCCRAEFELPDRGAGVQEVEEELETDESRNCIFVFGCQPLGSVSAVSTIAMEFIEQLEECEK